MGKQYENGVSEPGEGQTLSRTEHTNRRQGDGYGQSSPDGDHVLEALSHAAMELGFNPDTIAALLANPAVAKSAVQAIMTAAGEHENARVEVPPLTSLTDFVVQGAKALAGHGLTLSFFSPEIARVVTPGEGGKTFEVLLLRFNKLVTDVEVTTLFAERGFHRNHAAFVSYMTRQPRRGFFVSHGQGASIVAPEKEGGHEQHKTLAFNTMDSICFLQTLPAHGSWNPDITFVAFREVAA